MSSYESHVQRLRKICLAYPDSVETITWGKPHFRVNDKIFAGCGDEKGSTAIGCKLEMDHARQLIRAPGCEKAPYVGHKGWVSINPEVFVDWETIAELIDESYRLIAPKKSLAKLTESSASAPRKQTPRKQTPRKQTPRKQTPRKHK